MFKVGDWVIVKNTITQINYIEKVEGRGVAVTHYHTTIPNDTIKTIDEIQKWQPKEGEWCWMFSDGNLSPHIMQFSCMGLDGKTYLSGFAGYDKCEPFIGELPSFIKDK